MAPAITHSRIARLDALKNDFASILPVYAPGYLKLPASCAVVLEQNVFSASGCYFFEVSLFRTALKCVL